MRMKGNSFFHLINTWLEKICNFLGITTFIMMVVSVWLGVFYRYILVNPLTWTDELAIYGMIWLGYLGMGIAIKYNEHPSLTFFVERMPLLLQKSCKMVADIGVVVFLLVAIIWGFDYAIHSGRFRMTGALGISMTIPQLAVPIGSLFSLCQFILRLIKEHLDNSEGMGNPQPQ